MQTFAASTLFLSALLTPALAVAQYGGGAGSSSSTSSAAATTTASGSSATHTVQVGADGFVFTPDTVTAAKGDILEFHFTGSKLHDVVQGAFSTPCSDIPNGIYSSYIPDSDVFQVTLNNTDPMWLYCSTEGHCQGGMSMVVNQAASGANTLSAYQSAAKGTSSSTAPSNAQGGLILDASSLSKGGASSSASSSASGSASPTTSATTSSSAAANAGETVSTSFKNIALAVGLPVLAWLI